MKRKKSDWIAGVVLLLAIIIVIAVLVVMQLRKTDDNSDTEKIESGEVTYSIATDSFGWLSFTYVKLEGLPQRAAEDDIITFTAELYPAFTQDYHISCVLTSSTGKTIKSLIMRNGTYSFVMPGFDIVINFYILPSN